MTQRFNFTRAGGLASFSRGTKRAVDFSSNGSEWENGGGDGGDGLEPPQFQYAPIVQLETVPQEVFHCAFNPAQPDMVGFVSNDGKASRASHTRTVFFDLPLSQRGGEGRDRRDICALM